MATRESGLWRWLDGARYHYRQRLHMNRVENSVSSGMPDVEGILLKFSQFWIELKCCARPIRIDTLVRPKFRPAQLPWLRRRVAAGGRAFVLLQVGQGHDASRYLIWGDKAILLDGKGMTEEELTALSICDPKTPPHDIVKLAAGA